MSSMVGADIAAVRWFASSLLRRKQEIEITRQRLAATIEALPWRGADHDRFVERWQRVHNPGLIALIGELSDDARLATRSANQQEQASRSW